MLKDGIYEQVVSQALDEEITESGKEAKTQAIEKDEAPRVLTGYLEPIIKQGLSEVNQKKKNVKCQVDLTNRIISTIQSKTKNPEFESFSVLDNPEKLLSISGGGGILPGTSLPRPETSLVESSLFTGAVNEPQLYSELKKEILSSNRVDMLVSFIKWSGLRLIIDELKTFTDNGGRLRIITTSYMGATDLKAVEELSKLKNTQIKISYNTKSTRLHAKSYIFHRDTGFSTAYVGSSNLSGAAVSSGLEWNVKMTRKDLPDTMDKIDATFDVYWNSPDFETYKSEDALRLAQALQAEKHHGTASNPYTLDVRPYTFQQEILDSLEAEREVRGHYKNLVIAATGTGKTVISALDYKRFIEKNPNARGRLLFIAHREEILEQSLKTFRSVLKDPNFGDLYVGNHAPQSLDHVFVSIQTFNSKNFSSFTPEDYYDYIVVDEFHHAAAPTYQKLLSYYELKLLLGLTATPERMDGKDVFKYFDHRIAAEIRLPEAIDRQLLSPFQYFGVTDTVDLDQMTWKRGGYDKKTLSNVYTLSGAVAERRAEMIAGSLRKYVTDLDDVKGLGFCVSVEHANFMADQFNQRGIPSLALTGESSDEERRKVKDMLVRGEIHVIFTVDLYNEGVDIPEVNTVLFLRPTESLTVFLQQLGRGLRLSEGKECLTVLDFIGQANQKYNFEEKFSALLTEPEKNVQREIDQGFPGLPKGCYVQLERKAQEYVLKNIRQSIGNRKGIISRIETFEDETKLKPTLKNFLNESRISVKQLYKAGSFSRLSVAAGVQEDFKEPAETLIEKSLLKFSSVNSRRWIAFLLDTLPRIGSIDVTSLSDLERRMMQMFYATIFRQGVENWQDPMVKKNLHDLQNSPVMMKEVMDLLSYNYDRIDFKDQPVPIRFESPLDLHCTYSRDQILTALDFLNPNSVREGVKWLPDKNIEILFVTLNKSDKDYSPTTMYEDYSINSELFHWQSQSTTTDHSKAGLRYVHQRETGTQILLFVREHKYDPISGNAMPYTYLGPVEYVSHTGGKPMNVTWKLDYPIPAKYLKQTNKLAAG